MTCTPDNHFGGFRRTSRDDRRRYSRRLLTGGKRIKYDALIACWLAAAAWFWHWWLQPEHILPGMRYWALTFGLAWLFYLPTYFIMVFRRARVPSTPPPDPATTRVAMIVTKTPSEPFSIVRRTLTAMLNQTYPHDTWLADEDPAPETIAWCKANGVKISTRKGRQDYHRKEWPRRTRCKEGNLAFFYDTYGYENYDFVSQLDADHVPSPTYLYEIMRGFSDPAVGYVSAPSICSQNASESWAARMRLYTEAPFHGIIQTGNADLFAPMCIGSHYAVRTSALKQVGGLGPELAEDHSTTLMLNAGGWRGVHALDAIAEGDGPATVTDFCTQEFQWSRSLVTLLLSYTPTYFRALSPRLKFYFVNAQMIYPFIAFFMMMMYLLPVAAVVLDFRYADVTYPAFLLHAIAPVIVLTALLYFVRADGLFRPHDGKILGWERFLMAAVQWPWVLWGCIMAVRDRLTGEFVDFRITPKGEAADTNLPLRVVVPYVVLALGCLLPVTLVDGLSEAPGFYLLTLINGVFYSVVVCVIVVRHIRDNRIKLFRHEGPILVHLAFPPLLTALIIVSLAERGAEGLHGLAYGLGPTGILATQYTVSGAGMGESGAVHYTWNKNWLRELQSDRRGKSDD